MLSAKSMCCKEETWQRHHAKNKGNTSAKICENLPRYVGA
jgi:hypothetical protein